MPTHDPLSVAEQLATLDLLSRGRTMWAVGRGLSAMDLRGFGVTPDQALARMLDGLGELRNILIRGELDRSGIREPVNPTPDARLVRGWLACITSPTFALAADLGLDAMCGPYRPWPMAVQDLAHYRERFPQGQTSFTVGAFVHEDRAAARRLAGPGLAWMFQNILERSAPLVRAQIAPEGDTPFKWMLPLLDRPVSLPMLEALGLAIVGTPDDLVRSLEKLAATGLTRVSLMLGGGDVPRDALLAACDLLGAKVLPRIAEPRIVPENLLA
jgi:alkanesulfonate monooxygenase SsuD/methylene tetrahydromethanopterin reductase-like flavin-dependent oxidoreductase (luciferase family)